MSRPSRAGSHARALLPGTDYHVTGHAHDDELLFANAVDSLVFLTYVAEACGVFGVYVCSFCVMGTHFHLVLEDSRGVLSQFMHRVLSGYAGYYNRTRGRRRKGSVLDDRFYASVLDSGRYFRAACAYTHLNPLNTRRPLAPTAEAYRWSSAGFVMSPLGSTPADFCQSLVAGFGGIDGFLASFPKLKTKKAEENRRSRVEALLGGTWLDRSRALWGRTPEQYREALMDLAAKEVEELEDDVDLEKCHDLGRVMDEWSESRPWRPPYEGADLESSLESTRETCIALEPLMDRDPTRGVDCSNDLLIYALWRFTSACETAIGEVLAVTCEVVSAAVDRVRKLNLRSPGWSGLIRRLDWQLRWRLRGGPCRV